MKVYVYGQNVYDESFVSERFSVRFYSHRKKTSFFMRCVSYVLRMLRLYNDLKFLDQTSLAEAHAADVVIVHDSMPAETANEIMKRLELIVNNDTKLYFYFWNPIRDFSRYFFSSRWHPISFDYRDAQRYGLRYVGGFYFDYMLNAISSSNITTSDLFFIGIDKGRFKILDKLEQQLSKYNFKCDFIKVDNVKRLYNRQFYAPITYDRIIPRVIQTRCMFDFTQRNQFGLTLRIYEAIFLNKKILTTNQNIKYYDIYNPEYIYILNDTYCIESLIEFLQSPVSANYQEFYDKYRYESWLERVVSDKDFLDVSVEK